MVITWIVLIVAVALIWLFFKARHFKHRTYAILIILIFVFFFVTGVKVIGDNKLDVTTFNGVLTAGKLYFSWLFQLGGNVKNLVGNAINMNWGNITG